MKKVLLLAIVLIIGCATTEPTSWEERMKGWTGAGHPDRDTAQPSSLIFEIGMTLEDFKTKNKNVKGLNIAYADKNYVVYKKIASGKVLTYPVPFLYFKNGILIKQKVQPSNTPVDID